jgi:hypothetical protein
MQEQLPEARAFSPVHGGTVENPGPTHGPGAQDARRARPRGVLSLAHLALDKHCAAGAARTPKAARRAEGRMPGVKKGGSAPAEGDETDESLAGRRVCPPAVAEESKNQSKIKMDSSFTRAPRSAYGPASQFARFAHSRWNDERERSRWTPAFAGMTSVQDQDGFQLSLE